MTDQNSRLDRGEDLLGDPIDLRFSHIGAPTHKKTEEAQRLVLGLAAAEWTHARIAKQIGIDDKTLRKHYSRELAHAADMLEAAAIKLTIDKMQAGSLAAANRVRDLVARARAVPAPRQSALEAADLEATPAPKGKKEQLTEAAQSPPPSWADLLPPQ